MSQKDKVMIARRCDDLGRVVLPINIRKDLGIEEGDLLEIRVIQSMYDEEDKAIVIKKVK